MVSLSKIIDGVDVPVSAFSFIALIVAQPKLGLMRFLCSGSYLGNNTVISAAHCFQRGMQPADYQIHFLEQSADFDYNINSTRKVRSFHVHPQFDSNALSHDLAIIELEDEGPLNVPALSILQDPACYVSYEKYGTELQILGYGTTKPPLLRGSPYHLHIGDVFTVDPKYYQNTLNHFDDTMLLARGKELDESGHVTDACYADSGGPLFSRNDSVLVGAVSWGIQCGLPQFPGVYSRISASIDWLSSLLSLHPCTPSDQ